ncbi:hypothetical protein [Arthrobacter sedimenti]|uniref:hypothetical protein n=1 Tax=Arthrobacter sedimenti TaxID=2694931 RepID=UPI0026AD25A0|nr:hypothetical protein [Arthrobacter sedimenti]
MTILIDGEEEAGSPSLPLLLQRVGGDLRADVLVVADSGNWRVGVPTLTTSLRGLVLGTIEVRVLDHALHSETYGGPWWTRSPPCPGFLPRSTTTTAASPFRG